MKKIHYISPSLIPSRAANAVHVVHQCNGFSKIGLDVVLYAKRTIKHREILKKRVEEIYGIDASHWDVVTYYSKFSIADTLRIALMAMIHLIAIPKTDLIITRNLYAAFMLSIIKKSILFETHQLEYGVRKYIQQFIIQRSRTRTIVISKSLVKHLESHLNIEIKDAVILHDAARDGIDRLPISSRRECLLIELDGFVEGIEQWTAVCGYFGQLYKGRGIDVIEAIAEEKKDCLFIICGGGGEEVKEKRSNCASNIIYMGHVSHKKAQKLQASVDILLMPYQRSVSIGVKKHDTAKWMSPMKMFEYMAAGVPIISSDLPVLKEVLTNQVNAMLVCPDDPKKWIEAVDELIENPKLADSIGIQAHNDYRNKYTWTKRASTILDVAKSLP